MINSITASVVFSTLVQRSQDFMWRRGFISPMVCAAKEGAPVPFLFEHEGIIVKESDEEPDKNGIYRSVAMLHMQDPSQERYIEEVTRTAARATGADVIGVVLTCYYKRYRGDAEPNLELDPETTTLLHGCFYLRGNKEPHVVSMPYINRGETSTPTFDEEGKKFDVNFLSMPWTQPTAANPPKIEYPFED
ncbi:MAG: hypothetical protein GF334_01075 [Candidatus Altiarchaeales archaeon]|nr:hypothetical protein [Candidatus Altiarchaeales archaeon]